MNKDEIIPFERIKDAFNVHCDIIKRHGKNAEGTSIASFYIGCIILSSFACEIGLKALLSFENKLVHGHYLNDLFNELSPQIQENIIQCTDYNPDYFNKALLINKDHFIKWRYYYENDGLYADYDFMLKLFCAIKANVDTIKPER